MLRLVVLAQTTISPACATAAATHAGIVGQENNRLNCSYRQQVEDRCSELQAKSERLSGEINSMVGGLLSEQSDADIEREQLQALLGE